MGDWLLVDVIRLTYSYAMMLLANPVIFFFLQVVSTVPAPLYIICLAVALRLKLSVGYRWYHQPWRYVDSHPHYCIFQRPDAVA